MANQIRLENMSRWARHNLWPLPDGETAVRPGLRSALDITGDLVGFFSVRNDSDDDVYFYVVTFSAGACTITIYDESFSDVHSFAWGNFKPQIVTHAIAAGQIGIFAPGAPTVWGYVGSDLHIASAGSSLNTDLTEIEVPSGIGIGWAERFVVGSGNTLYFSDASDPRAFVSINLLNPPGASIVGLHVDSAGALVIVTTDGVHSISRDAAAAGQIVKGYIRKVCDYRAPGFGCSATSKGRVWGTTKKGIRLIDTMESFEVLLDHPRVNMTTAPRISSSDYRVTAMLFEGEDGIIVSLPSQQAACMFDDATQTFAWWTSEDTPLEIYGIGFDELGRMVLGAKDYLLYPFGNIDESESAVYGVFVGRIETQPHQSLVLREVHPCSDTIGSLVCAVAGEQKTHAPTQSGPIAGAAEDDVDTWLSSPMRSGEINFASRSDDHGIEVGASVPLARVAETLPVKMTGIGRERPTN